MKLWFLSTWSLFTAIPVNKACNYIKKKLEDDNSLPSRTKLERDLTLDRMLDIAQALLKATHVKLNRQQQQVYQRVKHQPTSSWSFFGRNGKKLETKYE